MHSLLRFLCSRAQIVHGKYADYFGWLSIYRQGNTVKLLSETDTTDAPRCRGPQNESQTKTKPRTTNVFQEG